MELFRCMRLCLCLALAASCFHSSWFLAAGEPVNFDDLRALQALKMAWGGGTDMWVGPDPCVDRWEGVICKGNRVISLYLVSRDLNGIIPPEIGGLSALQNLDISFNDNLRGALPDELGSLTNLFYLSLQKCSFKGEIPSSLGKLVNLTFLALNNNMLEGSIPPSLGALTHLKWFDVAYNRLSGPLPVSTNNRERMGLDTWPVIEHYHLNDNLFSGPIPPELGKAPKCIHMLLEVNKFTGPIPGTFGNLSALEILNVHYNELTGPIPSSLNKIITNGTRGLLQIRVSNNRLTGTVPVFSALTKLEYVDFSNNSFDSQIFPSWLNASASRIQTIRFEHANLTGPLPADILAYPALQGLYLKNNSIDGALTIPVTVGRKLRYVALQNNKIVTILATDRTAAKNVEILLQGNPLCTDPNSIVKPDPKLCNATQPAMEKQWVSPLLNVNNCGNQFCDPGLVLNPLQCRCSRPLVVTLEVRAPTFTHINDLSLWDSLLNQTLTSLKNLTQHENPPLQFEDEQLWIHDASFNGSLLRVEVNMYFFPLVGESMDRVTADFITRSFTLQKVKYYPPFKPELVKAIQNSEEPLSTASSGLSRIAIIGIAVGAASLLLLVGFLVSLACVMKGRVKKERELNPFGKWDNMKGGAVPRLKGANYFSFDDMKRLTNNFSEDNLLGEGGYGKVYKGIQAGTGAMVAVKRAQEGSKQGATEFKNEIELLSRAHHCNLVGLVGFCCEKEEQMLVYEYMPNGTLTEALRGRKAGIEPLDWDRRLLIALGAARGLAYLHDNADPPILHRDVKSPNILLDKKLNAKVADFGLSVLVPNEGTYSFKPTIKGTMGYLDPEYYMTSVMSPKSDVYSFGVVLLEILTGKPPVSSGGHIVREVRSQIDRSGMEGVREMLDPALADTPQDELETFLTIALSCVEDTSLERPSMHEVMQKLEVLVGPKAQIMPGGGKSTDLPKGYDPGRRAPPLSVTDVFSDDFEPASGQFSQGSTSSQRSGFNYSGGFAPFPVQPK
ncbi:leucine-rich repeat receptor protein kinase HPCA1 isoform X1 [Physcomitrium patens]|uniref:non-specific serine/threonine protein kinase n=2 Tax=Physcomitrium patens TaxID=3218 RepID=A0A2K1IJQ2_PHYPA|nr:probable leucine-rich repeat receptor-like protein kinase At5g49770 isoform X1 [Physcomitrium patens]PNR29507.1 hypothetical protein PHYPA_028201 [Physcomitrium patens]|eukprot:XP_024362406.1 probable leucine-rich repeat receptor-like protein kinase At5g49770 isoform X1 [Physcomitrella patens]